MKLKKPPKDHRGNWDLVIVNGDKTLGGIKVFPVPGIYDDFPVTVMWLEPGQTSVTGAYCGRSQYHYITVEEARAFIAELGIDAKPFNDLVEEKGLSDGRT